MHSWQQLVYPWRRDSGFTYAGVSKTRVNVSSGGDDNAYDALYGPPKVTASTTQSLENIVENREFLQGMRTGGRAHGYVVDGIVVRSEAFSTGENFLRVSFSQK